MNEIYDKSSGVVKKGNNILWAATMMLAVTPNAVAANKGNVSAAVTTLIVGAILSVVVSWLFSLKKNPDGKRTGIKTGPFFLLLSILLLIVFVAGTAAFFVFM